MFVPHSNWRITTEAPSVLKESWDLSPLTLASIPSMGTVISCSTVRAELPGYSVTTAATGKLRSGSRSMPIFCREITPKRRVIITSTVMATGLRIAKRGKFIDKSSLSLTPIYCLFILLDWVV
jgi:hypothetical protein